MAEKKHKGPLLLRPYIILPVAAALIITAALFWYPPLWQAGYAPADPAPFFTQRQEGIDLNTATVAELSALPGIGEKRAEAIIEYRTQHGPFTSTGEVMEVSGIGPGIYEQIKDLITAG